MKPNRSPNRLRLAAALLALSLPFTSLHAQSGADPIRATLEQAKESGSRSVIVHVQGSTIALLVTEIGTTHVIGRSAQHERIVVRLDRIDAVAF